MIEILRIKGVVEVVTVGKKYNIGVVDKFKARVVVLDAFIPVTPKGSEVKEPGSDPLS